MDKIELRTLRIRLLIHLDRVYPKRLDDVTLRGLESDEYGLLTVRRELHYLAEKGLVNIKQTRKEIMVAVISAKGRDLVVGEFEEIGIAPAASYGYPVCQTRVT